MGVDWVRFHLRDGTALEQSLIDEQARAFRSIYTLTSPSDTDYALLERINLDSYLKSSRAIRKSILFPKWDNRRGCARDIPDLEPSWRVMVVGTNPAFSPWQHCSAHRTILPDELGPQVTKWKQWSQQVTRGDHDDYLRELYLSRSTATARDHWDWVRGTAASSIRSSARWTRVPEFIDVRDAILRFIAPSPVEARLDPLDELKIPTDECKSLLKKVFKSIAELQELTAAWNRIVPISWKVSFDPDNYTPSFREFKGYATHEWVLKFFIWADRCVEHGFGLYLDY